MDSIPSAPGIPDVLVPAYYTTPIFGGKGGARTHLLQSPLRRFVDAGWIYSPVPLPSQLCGQGGIRTPEAVRQQIYSLPVLTAYLPTRYFL